MFARARLLLLALCTALAWIPDASAYSVLTHEQLIDLTWNASIVPLLKSRYPDLTLAQLEDARAYAYGGCVIQDIGYYPFGDAFFSDLTHYVRSGDFVVNLFRNAANADELAFAIGALSHYIGDNIGHSEATNLAVPLEFPKLQRRFGKSVNYAEGEHQHVQTEFAFDINEIAQHRFAPVHYLRHVGLEVPTRQLALAFYQTYGLAEDFTKRRGRRINVGGYRFAVRNFIPRIAYAVTILHRRHEPADTQSAELARLESEVAVVARQNGWDPYRKKPGIGTYSLAGLLLILPKVGPLKLVAIKGPSAATEITYVRSVLHATDALNASLRRFTPPPALRSAASPDPATAPGTNFSPATGQVHPLVNRDLDTGHPVQPAGYRLTDITYASLLHRLVQNPSQPIPLGVRADVLAYFTDLSLPFATKANASAWATLQADLATLKTVPASTEPELFPTYGQDDPDNVDAAGDPNSSPERNSVPLHP